MLNVDVCSPPLSRLDNLARLSKSLNQETNQINSILTAFEKRIGEMNLGVEAWVRPWSFLLPGHFQTDNKGRWSALGPYSYDDECLRCDVLGYGILPDSANSAPKGSRYGLLVRTEMYHKEHEETDQDPYWVFDHVSSTAPLLQSSRELRLASLERLEYLVEALEEEATRLLSSIEKGRKVLENL